MVMDKLETLAEQVTVYKCPSCNRFLCKGYYAPGSKIDHLCRNCKTWTRIEIALNP